MGASNACLIAIDQGTTSTRTIAFAPDGSVIASAQQEFQQIFPEPGWVEHDAEVIWATVVTTARQTIEAARAKKYVPAAIGITNQRETTVVWERATGRPIHNAVVWQDRRTAPRCRELATAGHEAMVGERTGLVLDPYFSATKAAWILDRVEGARARAKNGELAFGTIDTWLIWRLTGGRVHATDATNASRTSLWDINEGGWAQELLDLFGVPAALLPEVRDCASDYGASDPQLFGAAIPIRGVAGDQQAATVGQACFAVGDVKSTYGTGAFMILNTGAERRRSQNRLLATIAYRLNGKTTYALEGSVLSAGSTIQWLRDGLGIISKASEVEALAATAPDARGVHLVPAFTGLGAPYWDPDARGAILGLTRDAGRGEIARAALESTAFQTFDLLDAMARDGVAPAALKVDGGMAANDAFLQLLADIVGVEVVRPVNVETTAWGAAFLAGLGAGLFASVEDGASLWRADRSFQPALDAETRAAKVAGWRKAVARVRG